MNDPINMTAGADNLAWDVFRADNASVPEAELRAGFPAEAGYALNIAKHLRAAGWAKKEPCASCERRKRLRERPGQVIQANILADRLGIAGEGQA